ncbi:MAG TPA: DUF1501 domain-containing protein [Pirellulales bacterium]|nr:DUF1501 domain-containing protein [Pirellulales bacterium]
MRCDATNRSSRATGDLISRREALVRTGCGFGAMALAGMLADQARAEGINPLAPRMPHHTPRAKRVIFLFMQGGPSHVDSFDYKPLLAEQDGKQLSFADARVIANTGMKESAHRVMKSPWKFSRYGETGRWVSELFPETARHVDDLCFVHSMHTEGVAHGPATLFLHCGATNLIRPSVGSWIVYGLGSENENLPAFVAIAPSSGNGGPRNFGNAFLPAVYQGIPLGNAGAGASEATIKNLTNARLGSAEQRRQLDLLGRLNAEQLSRRAGDSELEAVIQSYELAWRMQTHAPDALDLSHESAETLEMYGIGQSATDDFGRKCLLARRLCEAGVRYVQVSYGDNTANPAWDQHSNLPKHADHARAVDRPVYGLLADLKRRGLLEDTLVWWGGEFGRTPYAEKNGTGRDHNPGGFTMWLAGAGVKPGFAYGQTDEFGHQAIADKVHMHDLHATLLHLLGLDHEALTFRYAGRNFRLTDVAGNVVRPILA